MRKLQDHHAYSMRACPERTRKDRFHTDRLLSFNPRKTWELSKHLSSSKHSTRKSEHCSHSGNQTSWLETWDYCALVQSAILESIRLYENSFLCRMPKVALDSTAFWKQDGTTWPCTERQHRPKFYCLFCILRSESRRPSTLRRQCFDCF